MRTRITVLSVVLVAAISILCFLQSHRTSLPRLDSERGRDQIARGHKIAPSDRGYARSVSATNSNERKLLSALPRRDPERVARRQLAREIERIDEEMQALAESKLNDLTRRWTPTHDPL